MSRSSLDLAHRELPPDLLALRNLGPVSVRWLVEVGITDAAALEALGAVEAFRRIRRAGASGSLNLLYALQAALWDVAWTDLPREVRIDLRRQVARLP